MGSLSPFEEHSARYHSMGKVFFYYGLMITRVFSTATIITNPGTTTTADMVTDFTCLPMLNASLLDKGTTSEEAMAMCNNGNETEVVEALAPGLYSADQFKLTAENVDKVLENVRPYLIADGGNVDVVSVENGVVSLKIHGG